MSTSRNRGKEGSDDRLFGDAKMHVKIKESVKDMHYLLSRGFAEKSSVQLVGNRYKLNSRQQKAVQGMSASSADLLYRKTHHVSPGDLVDKRVIIDGFNLLIILESALSGAYIFKGQDSCYRDVSGVHGTYKRVQKTEEALLLVGNTLKLLGVSKVDWIFDKPVSNSGRLKTILRELSEKEHFYWNIELENNPDTYIVNHEAIAISSDAWVLNHAKQWFNLAAYIIEKHQLTTHAINAENE